ncbi:NUDIX domain-containing protein [Agromyces protaetiae]|uniref:NUDIX domain-containing protein n=1 Tax=Agromyces protaetiae TaxID=2509455 RepID=A0A4P6FC99_9MICO|nr:NUDIX domain-containing protein [Agromyces protaetiae]QAY71959.1 NUDIX domain-containing protein [Agromyces protaetiae]
MGAETDLSALTDATTHGFAATVVLLRDGAHGLEVLLIERPRDRGSFAGAWVFPGGLVEASDADSVAEAGGDLASEAASRRAAARETEEEVGLVVDEASLVPFSKWTPPAGSPKHLVTTFFAARAPEGRTKPSPDEVMALEWLTPQDALDRHAAGSMTLWPPTWVTLAGLRPAKTVDDALAEFAVGDVQPYVSRFNDDRTTIFWKEDEAYDDPHHDDHPAVPDDAPDAVGNRHRLMMDRLPWIYLNDF